MNLRGNTLRGRRLATAWLLTATTLTLIPAPPAAAHEDHAVTGEFIATPVFEGLDRPVVAAFSPDNQKIFIGEKGGTIKVFDGVDDTDGPDVISVLPDNVHDYLDRGLLGLAVHPDYATGSPYLYVLYSWDHKPGGGQWGDGCSVPDDQGGCVIDARLSRIPIGATNQPTGPEDVLIQDRWCQQSGGHSIGTVAFGPDGALYVGAGDGASGNTEDYGQIGGNPCGDPSDEGGALRSQDLMGPGDPVGFNGSIIRVDPETGDPLPDNPLVGNGVADDDAIIAFGLRNPYRFTPRPGSYTGTSGPEVYVSDTGWWRWEEINLIADATDSVVENFGWPCYAGNEFDTDDPNFNRQPNYNNLNLDLCEDQYNGTTTSALTLPFLSYEHSNDVVAGDGCTTGGSSAGAISFYETGNYPHEYDGALFFSDYSRQCMWVMYPDGSGGIDADSLELFSDEVGLIVDLKTGTAGDLFFVNYGDFDFGSMSVVPDSGSLQRMEFFSENRPPTAAFTATPQWGEAPLSVDFDATGSTDPDGDPLTYAWDLDGDGQYDDATGSTTTRIYPSTGSITVGLRVGDGEFTDTETVVVSPGDEPPTASIDSFPDEWATGEPITLVGSGFDAADGELAGAALEWVITIFHCNAVDSCHTHDVQTIQGATATFDGPEHEYPSFLQARLTVTDSAGLTDSQVVDLMPATVEITLETIPPALEVRAFNLEGTSPLTFTAIKGSPITIAAITPQQGSSGFTHAFVSWSDEGAAAHSIIPLEDTTLTATFTYDLSVPPTWPNALLQRGAATGTTIDVSWSGAIDNAVVTGYNVYVDGSLAGTTPASSFTITDLTEATEYEVTVQAVDAEGNESVDGPTIAAFTRAAHAPSGVGLVTNQSRWDLTDADGATASFFFGTPGDYPFVGDWDCDGVDTPGLYRQSDGFVYLRNSNTLGMADLAFHFGIAGDVPVVGDFNGDGCDTVSVYRRGHVFIINELGEDGGNLGFAEYDYWFGIRGDSPFTGDFDADGVDEVGLFREANGFVYFSLNHPSSGAAATDNEFFYGIRNDQIVAGDWTNDYTDTVGIFRAADRTFYLRYTNTLGTADEILPMVGTGRPVAGAFGLT